MRNVYKFGLCRHVDIGSARAADIPGIANAVMTNLLNARNAEHA